MCVRGNAEQRAYERDAPKPVINKARSEVNLGDLTFEYDDDTTLLVVKHDADIITAGDGCSPVMWEGFLKAIERLTASGPLLSALQQIDQLARDKRPSGRSREAEKAVAQDRAVQIVGRVVGIVRQVLDEYERTSPEREDTRHVSMLEEGSTGLRGVAPEDVRHALNVEADWLGAEIEAINWQVTEFGDHRVVFLFYHFVKPDETEGVRCAVHADGNRIIGEEPRL